MFDDLLVGKDPPSTEFRRSLRQITTNVLQANPKISTIFSSWAPGAFAVKQAAKSLGLLNKVIIVGFDGDQSALKAIRAGEILVTTRQQPYVMGQ
jgi:ribose transport system substrate-binding protein